MRQECPTVKVAYAPHLLSCQDDASDYLAESYEIYVIVVHIDISDDIRSGKKTIE